jgi:Ca2+-transporting ATPase
MTFTVLCFSQLGHVMAIRSDHKSIFSIGIFSNIPMLVALFITITLQLMVVYMPFFNEIFKTQPLTFKELAFTLAVSSIIFWAVEAEKLVKKYRNVSKSPNRK